MMPPKVKIRSVFPFVSAHFRVPLLPCPPRSPSVRRSRSLVPLSVAHCVFCARLRVKNILLEILRRNHERAPRRLALSSPPFVLDLSNFVGPRRLLRTSPNRYTPAT